LSASALRGGDVAKQDLTICSLTICSLTLCSLCFPLTLSRRAIELWLPLLPLSRIVLIFHKGTIRVASYSHSRVAQSRNHQVTESPTLDPSYAITTLLKIWNTYVVQTVCNFIVKNRVKLKVLIYRLHQNCNATTCIGRSLIKNEPTSVSIRSDRMKNFCLRSCATLALKLLAAA